MRALLEDGREVDLGRKHIGIVGEVGDDPELIRLVNVGAVAIGCRLEAHDCYLTAKSNRVLFAQTEGEA